MARLISIFFIFACGVSVALANNDISQFVFTTNSQTIKPNEISEIITVQAQDADGNSTNLLQTTCLELATSSNTGEFSSSNTDWNPVKILTMSKGSANRNFYYKDPAVGVYELSIKASLRPEGKPTCASWPKDEWDIKWNAKQNIVVSSALSNGSSQANSSMSSPSPQSSSASPFSGGENIISGSIDYNYKTEQISAEAGKDKTAVAGADIVLEGEAYGFKKEPLGNVRYLWTLGDGSYREGKNIRHIYKYPGNYIAVLNVSSGNISASDRANIKVIPNELQIIEAKSEFIKLKNKSGVILDVSGWFLRVGGAIFKFPDYSLVAADSELIIPSDISGLKSFGNNIPAEILYPNGSVAFSYLPVRQAGLSVAVSSYSSSKPKEVTSSKSAEEKKEITAVLSAYPKNYSSSPDVRLPDGQGQAGAGSGSSQNFVAEKNLHPGEADLASVITIGDKNNPGAKTWLILAVIMGILGGAGMFLARKFTHTEK